MKCPSKITHIWAKYVANKAKNWNPLVNLSGLQLAIFEYFDFCEKQNGILFFSEKVQKLQNSYYWDFSFLMCIFENRPETCQK